MQDGFKLFAIVSEPRTGSTALSSKLRSLAGVNCQGEVFHPDEIFCGVDKSRIPDKQGRDRSPVAFLETLVQEVYREKGRPTHVGFKIFFDHNRAVLNHILETQTPVVLLERKNKLAQYSSLEIAKKTGKWHSKQQLTPEQEERNQRLGSKVSFSALRFIAFSVRSRYRFARVRKRIEAHKTPFRYVEYETMFEDAEWRGLVEFLEVETRNLEVQPVLEKQNPGSIFDRFSNRSYALKWCRALAVVPVVRSILSLDGASFLGS